MFGKRKKKSKKEREAETAECAESFSQALTQLDLFGERLDVLKQSLNDQAKTLARTPTPVPPPMNAVRNPLAEHIPTPALAFMPPFDFRKPPPVPPEISPDAKSKPRGRYSSVTSEGRSEVRKVPRPDPPAPQKASGPQRTRSGRFYLQLAEAADADTLRKAREQISKFGRVVDSGRGTASDPKAGWLEVAVRPEDKAQLAEKLAEAGVKDQLEKMVEVDPGEGRLQARQYELFRKRMDSSSGR